MIETWYFCAASLFMEIILLFLYGYRNIGGREVRNWILRIW